MEPNRVRRTAGGVLACATMRIGALIGSVGDLRRKLKAVSAVIADPAATEHERANAAALKARLEQRLKDAGVPTTYSCYDGMIHGFFGMPAVLDKGKLAVAEASAALKKAFTAQAAAAR